MEFNRVGMPPHRQRSDTVRTLNLIRLSDYSQKNKPASKRVTGEARVVNKQDEITTRPGLGAGVNIY